MFRIRFLRCFINAPISGAALYKSLSCPFRIVFCGLRRGADDVHANADSVLCFSCWFLDWWGGGWGWGGLMTSMRMRLCVVFLFLFCVLCIDWGGGWGHFAWFLRCFLKISGRHCADPRRFAHVYLISVQGLAGWLGADDVRASAAYMYGFSFCSVHR